MGLCNEEPSVPPTLSGATERVRGIEGVCLLGTWGWCTEERLWALHCKITIDVPQDCSVPVVTDWYVLVSHLYPDGNIQFFPAKKNGLKGLFPHQYPTSVSESKPWTGDFLCLEGHLHALDRLGVSTGPRDWRRRLKWTFERAIKWLQRAAHDDLVRKGDHFELPLHQPKPKKNAVNIIIVSEGSENLPDWENTPAHGFLDFRQVSNKSFAVHAYRDPKKQIIREVGWGTQWANSPIMRSYGIWVRLDDLPVIPPWQQPQTWGELCRDRLDRKLNGAIKKMLRQVSAETPVPLLIGSPIPKVVGGQYHLLHWQALLLPAIQQRYRGFRDTDESRWEAYCKFQLHDKKPLPWTLLENWHPDTLSTRGRLPKMLREKKVVLIGVGALGAPLAEHLVRGGMTDMILIDHDDLVAGNLVRHPLTMKELGNFKAEALRDRLNSANPHACVQAISKAFLSDDEQADQVREADLIIDTTASDDVIAQLNMFDWKQPKHFVSMSIGMKARQFYAYSARSLTFPLDDFYNRIDPYIQSERDRLKDSDIQWEGVGCYHPVFEARNDDMGLWAAMATKLIVKFVKNIGINVDFVVLKQCDDSGIPQVLHRVY